MGMLIIFKCENCGNQVGLKKSGLVKLLKKHIIHKKGERADIISKYNNYYYQKNYYAKAIICPICKNKIFINKPKIEIKELKQTNTCPEQCYDLEKGVYVSVDKETGRILTDER